MRPTFGCLVLILAGCMYSDAAEVQWASKATASTARGAATCTSCNGVRDALGAPSPCFGCDITYRAWTPKSTTTAEWLEVGFSKVDFASKLYIYISLGTGILSRVQVRRSDGVYQDVWRDGGVNNVCGKVFSIALSAVSRYRITSAKVYFKPNVNYAVDAVGLEASAVLVSQWASKASASSTYRSCSVGQPCWDAHSATGAPDVGAVRCVDDAHAWAPKPANNTPQWLLLEYTRPVYATRVEVHETNDAPFVQRVELLDEAKRLVTQWAATATDRDRTVCGGWFVRTFAQTSRRVKFVKVTTVSPAWEEIDAVKLIGDA